jgi:light-regulated signal transduction histidine kinase (bacteriophytochrome)
MCYEWDPHVIWLHVAADAVIALAYYSIPLTLLYFVRKRKDLAFDWMLVCFAIFIVACGTTHLMEILNIWHPTYWLSGIIKVITALASIITAVLLIRLIPQALKIPSPAALQNEIDERTKALERVASLNQELVAQTSNLAASNRELETFSYSVSHDLRAPLRHISGYIQLLVEETPALPDESARYAAKIARSATHMGMLIDNLLAFSQTGKAVLQRQQVDTAALVAQVRDELAPDMQGREIDWKIEALPSVFADKSLLKQAWLNLISNAIKYTRERQPAVIVIGGRELPGECEFYVRDNGAGFDMKHVDKLFGVFQRLHSQDNFDGTGIGLANVHRIITRHGGRIWAEGQVGVGATFYFTLPQTPDR